jgi:ABC-type polysaccharide/polyol phosphate transport system ATPase subunit
MSDLVVRFEGVGKMYKIFPTRRDNLLDALGLQRLMGRRAENHQKFWALRGIDIELSRGERIGIIGRNGAGKSTLLKLVTGNIPPTEGHIDVRGQVQALLEIGGGLHPEFTGRENVRASLGFLGLSGAEIESATEEIAEFTELGHFLDQSFKTYSLGMQARLSFAIATAVTPEILIVDEILGAGDAYFFARSTERMRRMIADGASVLLVSHALDQVTRFCHETIWLDRGRIVMRGETTEVVKAYESFIRKLDGRRLEAKNRKGDAGSFDAFEREGYTAELSVGVSSETGCEVSEVTLYRDGEVEESLVLGAAQDADLSQASHLSLVDTWSGPLVDDRGAYFRALDPAMHGAVSFHLWFLYPDSEYRVELRYRSPHGPVEINISGDEAVATSASLPTAADWATHVVTLPRGDRAAHSVTRSRWDGVEGFVATNVRIVDARGEECAVFEAGAELSIAVDVTATRSGRLPLIPAAIVFRSDGVIVTRHVSDPVLLDVTQGAQIQARLDLGSLLLGNGSYLVSIGLYATLDLADIEPSEFYDYYDKSFEFKIVGKPTVHNELVLHPGRWQIELPRPTQAEKEAAQL